MIATETVVKPIINGYCRNCRERQVFTFKDKASTYTVSGKLVLAAYSCNKCGYLNHPALINVVRSV
jgi:hypothetical protein